MRRWIYWRVRYFALWLNGRSHHLCEWLADYYDEHYWYEDVARDTGRILWRAHDDFWIGKHPIFWD